MSSGLTMYTHLQQSVFLPRSRHTDLLIIHLLESHTVLTKGDNASTQSPENSREQGMANQRLQQNNKACSQINNTKSQDKANNKIWLQSQITEIHIPMTHSDSTSHYTGVLGLESGAKATPEASQKHVAPAPAQTFQETVHNSHQRNI